MSSVTFKHDEENPSCHHCHISKPIPLSELIRTHPLRSSIQNEQHYGKIEKRSGGIDGPKEKEIKKTKFSDEIEDIQGQIPPPPPPPPPLPNNRELLKQKSKENLVTQKSSLKSSKDSLRIHKKSSDRSLSGKVPTVPKVPTIRPVHSFLHHVFDDNAQDRQPLAGPSHSLGSEPSSHSASSSIKSIKRTNGSKISSPDLILDARQLTDNSKLKKSSLDRLIKGPDGFYRVADGHSTTYPVHTYHEDPLSRPYYAKVKNSYSGSSSSKVPSGYSRNERKKKPFYRCTFPSGLLFAGYSLLIVIAVVIAVALSQRERRISQTSTLTHLGGNSQSNAPGRVAIRRPAQRTRIATTQRRVRPVQNVVQEVARPAPVVPQVVPVTPAPPKFTVFKDEDFDYFEQSDFSDQDFVLNGNQNSIPDNQVHVASILPAFNAIPTFRQSEVENPAPSHNRVADQPSVPAIEVQTIARAPANPRQQQSVPRRNPPQNLQNSFRQEFNLDEQQQTGVRGQRQPAVKIVKSWSDRHADGTYSWGYINTDGSFKNETKGVDCVVRGVYGYVDVATGETLSFPYESGNPCNPDEPDLYFDYDSGTINSGGKVIQRPSFVASGANRRRPQAA